jgi:hypothetical protein
MKQCPDNANNWTTGPTAVVMAKGNSTRPLREESAVRCPTWPASPF